MKQVDLITDGSCLGNPGPGVWACLLRFGSVKKELFGFSPRTTCPHATLRLNLGADYVPPKPQAGLFEDVESDEDEDDEG